MTKLYYEGSTVFVLWTAPRIPLSAADLQRIEERFDPFVSRRW